MSPPPNKGHLPPERSAAEYEREIKRARRALDEEVLHHEETYRELAAKDARINDLKAHAAAEREKVEPLDAVFRTDGSFTMRLQSLLDPESDQGWLDEVTDVGRAADRALAAKDAEIAALSPKCVCTGWHITPPEVCAEFQPTEEHGECERCDHDLTCHSTVSQKLVVARAEIAALKEQLEWRTDAPLPREGLRIALHLQDISDGEPVQVVAFGEVAGPLAWLPLPAAPTEADHG